MRRSHHGLKPIRLVRDPDTGRMILPHTASPYSGKYKGREVIDVMKKVDKAQKKAKQKHQH